MHNHTIFELDLIDYNLYPALFQVFIIILCGYLSNYFQLITESQAFGLNRFISTFALPSLLFYSLCTIDFESVNWNYILSIFLSKTCVFLLLLFGCFLTMRPTNLGIIAIFAIFVSQSNDFALGDPIIKALYSNTIHQDYLRYIYLISPISLCILNPIGFLMLEINKKLEEHKKNETNNKKSFLKPFNLVINVIWGTISNPIVFMTPVGIIMNILLKGKIPWLIEPFTKSLAESFSALALFSLGFTMVNRIHNLNLNKILIITILIFVKSLIFPLITREFVFHIETSSAIRNNLTNQSDFINSLSTYAFLYGTFPTAPSIYFYITKYNLIANDIISPGLVFGTMSSVPLMIISAKMISFDFNHINGENKVSITSNNLNPSIITIMNNNSMHNSDLIYINKEKHFESISCKISLLSSYITLICLIWIIYLFLSKLYYRLKPHSYTLILVFAQLLTAIIEIIWNYVNINAVNSSNYKTIYLIYSISTTLLTLVVRCLTIAIILNILELTFRDQVNLTSSMSSTKILKFIQLLFLKLVNSLFLKYFISFVIPILLTIIIFLFQNNENYADKSMIVKLNNKQIFIYVCVLIVIIFTNIYCLIKFIRLTNENEKSNRIFKLNAYIDEKSNNNDNNNELDDEFEEPLIQHNNSVILTEQFILREANENDYSDEPYSKNNNEKKYQILKHLSLIILLTISSFMSLFFLIWDLFGEIRTSIFYEIQLIHLTFIYGQGFWTFLAFGFDKDFIICPIINRIKKWFTKLRKIDNNNSSNSRNIHKDENQNDST